MRAKLKITTVTAHETCEQLEMSAVCPADSYPEDGSDENNTYSLFTPQADLKMVVTNPDLWGKFKPGQMLYVDFSPVE